MADKTIDSQDINISVGLPESSGTDSGSLIIANGQNKVDQSVCSHTCGKIGLCSVTMPPKIIGYKCEGCGVEFYIAEKYNSLDSYGDAVYIESVEGFEGYKKSLDMLNGRPYKHFNSPKSYPCMVFSLDRIDSIYAEASQNHYFAPAMKVVNIDESNNIEDLKELFKTSMELDSNNNKSVSILYNKLSKIESFIEESLELYADADVLEKRWSCPSKEYRDEGRKLLNKALEEIRENEVQDKKE